MHNATGSAFFYPLSCHMWKLQCPTPSQGTTLFICFPPTWEASWDMSNAKPPWGAGKQGPPQRTSLKSFLCSSTQKTTPETCPVSTPSLTLINCRSLPTAKKWPRREQSSQPLAALLPKPSCCSSLPPWKQCLHWGRTASALSLLPSPGFHSSFRHRDEAQWAGVNCTKWGLTQVSLS